jgi:hypothetical protein
MECNHNSSYTVIGITHQGYQVHTYVTATFGSRPVKTLPRLGTSKVLEYQVTKTSSYLSRQQHYRPQIQFRLSLD